MNNDTIGKRLKRISRRFGKHVTERILLKQGEKEEQMPEPELKEFLVTVQMTKTEQEPLADTLTVMAETECAAVDMVEGMCPVELESKLDGCDKSGVHNGWVYECLNDQEIELVEAQCMEEEETTVNG